MLNYVINALERFQHPTITLLQHSTHKWILPMYGATVQYSTNTTTTPKLDKHSITRVQSISGSFIYISRAVNPTMIAALNEISAKQDPPTTSTIKKTKMLMDCKSTQPDAIIRFQTINS